MDDSIGEGEYAAAREVWAVVQDFGFSREDAPQLGSVRGPWDGNPVENPPAALCNQTESMIENRNDSEAKSRMLAEVLGSSPIGMSRDRGFRLIDFLMQTNWTLEQHELELAARTYDSEELSGALPNPSHPPATRIELLTTEGDLVREVCMRLPPLRMHTNINDDAYFYIINTELLSQEGLCFTKIRSFGDTIQWILLSEGERNLLNDHYGERWEMFDGEYLRYEESCLERALKWYEPAEATDHETEFGAPEPPETIKIEDLPEATPYIN